jgi:hypothetical protein
MRPEMDLIERKGKSRLPKLRREERETYLPWNTFMTLVMKVHHISFPISWLSLVRETMSSEAGELEYQRVHRLQRSETVF